MLGARVALCVLGVFRGTEFAPRRTVASIAREPGLTRVERRARRRHGGTGRLRRLVGGAIAASEGTPA
jgi:hypothetical protein